MLSVENLNIKKITYKDSRVSFYRSCYLVSTIVVIIIGIVFIIDLMVISSSNMQSGDINYYLEQGYTEEYALTQIENNNIVFNDAVRFFKVICSLFLMLFIICKLFSLKYSLINEININADILFYTNYKGIRTLLALNPESYKLRKYCIRRTILAPYQEVAIGIFGIIDYFRYRMFVYKLERHGKITDCVNDTKSEILIKMLESDIENLQKKINKVE